jgi:hypothetical protein
MRTWSKPRNRLKVKLALGVSLAVIIVAGVFVVLTRGASGMKIAVVADSPQNSFVGAVTDNTFLYVGLLNGSVEKMNHGSGLFIATLALPDGNSAAHLLYYDGSLYVGTEFMQGAKDIPPYHIYRIDPQTMAIFNELPMNSPFANGYVFALNGYLWAGDGACTLYKIQPDT